MQKNSRNTSLLRVPQVLERFPVSKSKWWAGVKEGIYPQPIRLGSRCTMWRSDDIDQLIDRISRDSQWVFPDLDCGVLKGRFYWGLGWEVQVTSKTVIYRFGSQSHNKKYDGQVSHQTQRSILILLSSLRYLFHWKYHDCRFYHISEREKLLIWYQSMEVHRLVDRRLKCNRKPNLGDLIRLEYFESYHRQVTTETSSCTALGICRGLGIPYQIVSNDFTETSSYAASSVSSQKMA